MEEIRASARSTVLPNGLHISMLPVPGLSAASLSVALRTGYRSDPLDAQGLAHLHEHSMMLGSANFPKICGLSQFISQVGGVLNGTTAGDYTIFSFTVPNSAFQELCERVTDMITAPNLDGDIAIREIDSLESEYELTCRDVDTVIDEMIRETRTEPDQRKFSYGNKKSLQHLDARTAQQHLKNLHKKVAVGENIAIAFMAPDIDRSEEFVKREFQKIGTATQPHEPSDQPNEIERNIEEVFPTDMFQKLMKVEYCSEHLALVWIFRKSIFKPRRDVLTFVENHILSSHCGGVSSLLHLRRLGYDLSMENSDTVSDWNKDILTIKIRIDLSLKGAQNWTDIVKIIYYYLRAMQSLPPDQFQEEWQKFKEASEKDLEIETDDLDLTVIHLLENRPPGSPRIILDAGVDEYNDEDLRNVLDVLVNGQVLMLLLGEYKTDHLQNFTDISFSIEDIPGDLLNQCRTHAVPDEIKVTGTIPGIPLPLGYLPPPESPDVGETFSQLSRFGSLTIETSRSAVQVCFLQLLDLTTLLTSVSSVCIDLFIEMLKSELDILDDNLSITQEDSVNGITVKISTESVEDIVGITAKVASVMSDLHSVLTGEQFEYCCDRVRFRYQTESLSSLLTAQNMITRALYLTPSVAEKVRSMAVIDIGQFLTWLQEFRKHVLVNLAMRADTTVEYTIDLHQAIVFRCRLVVPGSVTREDCMRMARGMLRGRYLIGLPGAKHSTVAVAVQITSESSHHKAYALARLLNVYLEKTLFLTMKVLYAVSYIPTANIIRLEESNIILITIPFSKSNIGSEDIIKIIRTEILGELVEYIQRFPTSALDIFKDQVKAALTAEDFSLPVTDGTEFDLHTHSVASLKREITLATIDDLIDLSTRVMRSQDVTVFEVLECEVGRKKKASNETQPPAKLQKR